jgi:hypothetical protein
MHCRAGVGVRCSLLWEERGKERFVVDVLLVVDV